MTKFDISKMNEYLDKVKTLKGTKQKMGNPVTRALYEDRSIIAGKWLSIKEFEDSLSTNCNCKCLKKKD